MSPCPSHHSLVIGGTGMLSRATHWLATRSSTTVLVARRASRFAPGDGRFSPVDADWSHPGFQADLLSVLQAMPPMSTALLWLHEPEPTLTWLLPQLRTARTVLVLGCLDGQPEAPKAGATFATVRLGSMPTATGRRWLTDGEICGGAIAALEDGRSRVVGELAPLH